MIKVKTFSVKKCILAASILIVATMIFAFKFNDTWLVFAQWVHDMQTLITGLLATAAAIATICHLNYVRKEDARNKHQIARALIGQTISDFKKSCEEVVKILETSVNDWKNKTSRPTSSSLHFSFDSYDLIVNLDISSSFTEYLTELMLGANQRDKFLISDFISRLQLTQVRIRSLRKQLSENNSGVSETQFYNRIYELMVLDTFSNQLLEYSRNPALPKLPSIPDTVSRGLIFSLQLLHSDEMNRVIQSKGWPPKTIREKQKEFIERGTR